MSTRGFTLIELMITLVLLAILLLVALPSFTTTIERQRLKNATTELEALYRQARWEALRARQDVIIEVKSNGNSWQGTVSRGGVPQATVQGSAFPGILLCSGTSHAILLASRGIPANTTTQVLWRLSQNRCGGCSGSNGVTQIITSAGLSTLAESPSCQGA